MKITRCHDEIFYEQDRDETEEHFRAAVRTHMAEVARTYQRAADEYNERMKEFFK